VEYSSLEPDSRLLSRVAAGDLAALEEVYRRYLPTVWRYVYAQLRGNDQATRDVVSETFLAAIGALRKASGSIDCVPAWLTGIARNKVHDARRVVRKEAGPEWATDLPVTDDPAQQMLAEDLRSNVTRIMAQMDDAERTVLEWKYIEDLSVHEIAVRLNRTDKAVEAMLYRARNAFRELYEKSPNENV
jgi:RNA polymerase sigma-70 factor (ECF subfamily)